MCRQTTSPAVQRLKATIRHFGEGLMVLAAYYGRKFPCVTGLVVVGNGWY